MKENVKIQGRIDLHPGKFQLNQIQNGKLDQLLFTLKCPKFDKLCQVARRLP